ncbi:MAG: hypothetical protein H7840_02350 [Alphaproteobacteria bacterium]
MPGNLTTKVAITIVLLLAFSMALVTFLNYAKFARTFAMLEQSRILDIATEIESTIENGLTLGLELAELRNTQDVIARGAGRDPLIRSIEVLDAAGTVVYVTPADAPQTAAGLARQRSRGGASSDPFWTVADGDAVVVGLRLENSFGRMSGTLALRYSTAAREARLAAVRDRLATILGVVGAVFSLAAVGAVFLSLNGISRALRRMRRALGTLETTDGRTTPNGEDLGDSVLEREIAEYRVVAARALRRLDFAHRVLVGGKRR